jgi:ABC-2 type transport system permease protein
MGWSKRKKQNIGQLSLMIVCIILITYISSFLFIRIDLTSEKRYTLSQATKNILKDLDDVVYLKIYLDGKLNIPFKKMQKSIKEMLDEFRIYAKDNLQYDFINPFDNTNPRIREDVMNELSRKGLRAENILSRDKEGGTYEKIIFPGTLISYKGIELPINLLSNNPGLLGEQNINNSIQNLEYAIISQIRNITNQVTEKIAFIKGHGELDEYHVHDISRELANYFQIDMGVIGGNPGALDEYKAVIIAKPGKRFSEQDKFVIDQYIMNGGKVLWIIDQVNVSLDSLVNGRTLALTNDLNIDDLLFKYGVRINPKLIQDIQCNLLMVNVALRGNNPRFIPAPWLYHPLLSAPPTHPVTMNLNMIKTEFASPIDTISARKSVRKTVLLQSSKYSKLISMPALIKLEDINNDVKKEEFRNSYQPVAVLLEGQFESAFKYRILSEYFPDASPDFKERSVDTKMIIISDGDIIRNDIKSTPQGLLILPLGYDRHTQQTFGNKDFILNAIHYLTDNTGLINLRSKDIKLRLLDKTRINNEKLKWKLINTVVPVLIVILFGIIYNYIRRLKYASIKIT